jgi:hypothetical protein
MRMWRMQRHGGLCGASLAGMFSAVALGCAGCGAASPAQGNGTGGAQASPLSTGQELFSDLSTGNVNGAALLIGDDATWSGGPGCTPTPCAGRNAITTVLHMRANSEPQYTLSSMASQGDSASFDLQVSSKLTAAAGVARVLAHDTITVSGNKVSTITESFTMSDPQTAAFVTYLHSHTPAASSS